MPIVAEIIIDIWSMKYQVGTSKHKLNQEFKVKI
jgi:hypothetical protein